MDSVSPTPVPASSPGGSYTSATADGKALIRLDSIAKIFYTEEVETHALASVHLEVPAGEYLAIAGPSGCGKTTLLSILGLLDTPTQGEYLLDGQPVKTRILAPIKRYSHILTKITNIARKCKK